MEPEGALTATFAPTSGVVSSDYLSWEWEEVSVSANRDRGRREFRFFLIRRDGQRELAVVGPERSLRNMSYQCVLPIRSAIGLGVSVSKTFKRRKEVVDWLYSVIKGDEDEDGGFRSQRPVEIHPRFLREGSEVEVRSHANGCWYRGVIVELSDANAEAEAKIYYRDLPDPADDTKKLEEWIPTQSCIRPVPPFQTLIKKVEIGACVEAWYRCGWYEGFVVCNEFPDGILRVYLAGEKRELGFPLAVVRISREWSESRWIPRPSNEAAAAGESSSQKVYNCLRFEKESSTEMMAISNREKKLIDAIPKRRQAWSRPASRVAGHIIIEVGINTGHE